ncbi:hypothetical protein [Soonwooa sp.]|uniref:hypothetical protein n=1 Tax=Soonwooa sp. TaxID=1938592 RepID=UPI002636F455|nr:hypothetical protein [Soonwooa sp.]
MFKNLFQKYPTLIFIFPLAVFSAIGIVGLVFLFKTPNPVSITEWIVVILFTVLPLIFIYGFLFGFTISEKSQKQYEDIQQKLSADDTGLTILMPLFDKDCFIAWDTIDFVVYYNYALRSDFTEYHEGYKFYLNTKPVYTKYEKQWWLNRLFPKDSNSKVIDITTKNKHFTKLAEITQKYLNADITTISEHPYKGKLVKRETITSKDKTISTEEWKSSPFRTNEEIIYSRHNTDLEWIKKNYK